MLTVMLTITSLSFLLTLSRTLEEGRLRDTATCLYLTILKFNYNEILLEILDNDKIM